MVDHIYGRINLINDPDRPNMFIKELRQYIDYFQTRVSESFEPLSTQAEELLKTFKENLVEGIRYYKKIIPEILEETETLRQKLRQDLEALEHWLLSYSLAAV